MTEETKKDSGIWGLLVGSGIVISFIIAGLIAGQARISADQNRKEISRLQEEIRVTDFITANLFEIEREHREYLSIELAALRVRVETLEESIDPTDFRWAKIKLVREAVKQTSKDHGFSHGFARTEDLTTYAGAIVKYCEEYDVPIALALAVTRRESAFRPHVTSHAGAIGLMQVMPATGEEIAMELGIHRFRSKHLFKISTNTQFGVYYLSKMLDTFNRDEQLAVRAYNMGPTGVKRVLAGEYKDYFYETKCYRAAILGNQGEQCDDKNAMDPEGFRRYYEKLGL